jgi:hypothetical protein
VLNWKLFNPRDMLLIAIVAILVHLLAKPLYTAIDNATD